VVICGILIFTVIQFFTADPDTAFTSLALFLGASARIAPAVLRIQQNSIELKGSSGEVLPLLLLIDELKSIEPLTETPDSADNDYHGFEARVSVKEVTFTYPGSEHPVLSNVSLEIKPNCIYAIVGPSGAGKTTLVDILLGIFPPDQGSVVISGVTPSDAIRKWSGAIAYVPQDVAIINSTISGNLTMGYPVSSGQRELVNSAIELAQLSDYVASLPNGIDSLVGDRGTRLSGGQRQRLGLARALFTKPKLIILDEATSALDAQTEELISSTLLEMEDITVVAIAHKISTIKKADFIVYVNKGCIEAVGTLEEVRSKIPDFDYQISLMSI
jgi:ABC-type multidrug transport system fused ATPase/permease subunit